MTRSTHAMTARAALVASALLCAAAAQPAAQKNRETPAGTPSPKLDRPSQVRGDELTPRQQKAVEQGLAYLAAKQARNGSFGSGYGSSSGHAGITGLAGLAFMSAGNLPGRGRYGENVRKAMEFVLSSCQESGVIASDNTHGVMYGHGFATLFLAEVYGMSPDDRIKEKLQKAVKLIQKTQNHEGGWRYTPAPVDADISVTICQVMALRAARDAGIKVEKNTIDMAIQYVRRCQCSDGGFSYQAGQGAGSGFARSAAGVASLYYAGVFEGNEIKRGLDYLRQFSGGASAGRMTGMEGMYFYGHYYASQAMFLAGGDYWAGYYPAIRDQLCERQNKTTGAWSGEAGEDYATAMALLILQMPNRYLPVFHGKGPGT